MIWVLFVKQHYEEETFVAWFSDLDESKMRLTVEFLTGDVEKTVESLLENKVAYINDGVKLRLINMREGAYWNGVS